MKALAVKLAASAQRIRILPVALLLAFVAAQASAQTSGVPGLLSYQGRVTDVSGTPIGNSSPVNRTVTFKLYDSASGGTPLYAESQIVTISGGEFSVLIGNGTGVSGLAGPSAPALTPYVSLASIVTGNLYLGITVDDGTAAADPEITPRQQIVSAAFAFRAKVAEALADNALHTPMLADSSVTTNKIGAAQITTVKLADANVTTPKLADGAVTAAKLDTATIGLWSPAGANVYRASGNVGIGQSSPGFPLNFASSTGNKIALYGNSGSHYGFGIQSNLLQLYTAGSTADIAFGYGSSTSFTETMRIRGNGNLGLGTTSPTEKFHLSGGSALIQNSSAPALKLAGGSATADFGVATAAGNFSTSAAAGDSILRASGKLHLLSGNGTPALTVDTSNRVGFGTLTPTAPLEVVGGLQARDSSVTPNNNYPGTIRSTRTTGAGQHITLIRGTNAAWSLGYVPNTATFGIGPAATTDSSFNPSLRINTSGVVSIGVSDTLARLNVGSVTATWNFFGYLDTNGGHSGNGTYTNEPLSIYATGNMLAPRFFVSSDARIKTDLHRSDSAKDLETLARIEITDYRLKDKITSGSTPYKKVIAQQVEQAFPQAVTQQRGVIPDIYQHATADAGWVLLATDLKPGDRVRLIEPDSEFIREVLEVRAGAFRVDLPASATDVFVYGREVSDLRSVDYDAIAMLNVSATQELHRRVSALESELAVKDAALADLAERLSALEQLVRHAR